MKKNNKHYFIFRIDDKGRLTLLATLSNYDDAYKLYTNYKLLYGDMIYLHYLYDIDLYIYSQDEVI